MRMKRFKKFSSLYLVFWICVIEQLPIRSYFKFQTVLDKVQQWRRRIQVQQKAKCRKRLLKMVEQESI